MAKKQFKAESKRLMDLMINSIYTHKEIFLREIISNASDAIDKLAYLSLTDDSVKVKRSDLRITVTPDKAARTLTVSDNGIGMTAAELEQNLGTIAKSGSLQFKAELEGGESMTQEQFNALFAAYAQGVAGQPVEEWAQEAWSKAVAAGLFDGTKPQAPLTREQAALVLERLGLLNNQ